MQSLARSALLSLHATSRSIGGTSREAILAGEDSAVNGVCDHARVVLKDDLTIKDDIPKAEAVKFDPGGIEKEAELVAKGGHLGTSDVQSISRLATEATDNDVELLVRLGNTQFFAVFHSQNRSIPGSWAHVQTKDVWLPAGSPPAPSAHRRSTDNPKFQCKVCFALFVETSGCGVLSSTQSKYARIVVICESSRLFVGGRIGPCPAVFRRRFRSHQDVCTEGSSAPSLGWGLDNSTDTHIVFRYT